MAGRPDPSGIRLYRALLRAYPSSFRDRFGDEMVQVLGDSLRDVPPRRRASILARSVGELVRTVPTEHWAALRTSPAPAAAPAPAPPPAGPGTASTRLSNDLPSRRDFLRHAMMLATAGVGVSFAGASIGYLWPAGRGVSGGLIDVGSVEGLQGAIGAGGGTLAVAAARTYLVSYDPADDPDGAYVELAGGAPFLALYQRCVHLGCRVPWCTSSTRFECPCHQSRYNRWGEWQAGPAPRGLDRFRISVDKDRVLVDVREVVTGPARQANVLAEPPSGPSCLG